MLPDASKWVFFRSLLTPANSDPEAVGFVLAGGRSSRMGHDKALIQFAGQSLVARALNLLRQAGLSAAVAGARSALDADAPVVEDSTPDQGPLGGVCAALAATSAARAVFLPVDLPLLPASLVAALLHHSSITGRAVTVPSVNGFAQTFPAVLRSDVLPVLQSRLESGNRGCYSAFEAAAGALDQPVTILPVEVLVQSGQASHPGALPPSRWFLNVNAPPDLHRAEAMFTAAIA